MEQQELNPYAAPKARVDDAGAEAELAPELWNPAAGGAWSLLLSVAFGSWVTLQNWKALGEDKRIGISRVWFIVSLVVFVLVLSIPGMGLIGLPYLLIWYFVENRPQIRYIKERFGSGYPRRSWTKIVLLAFAMAVSAGFILGLVSFFMFRR